MAVYIHDTITPRTDFPVAMASDVDMNNGESVESALQTATPARLGRVKIGDRVRVNGDGAISIDDYVEIASTQPTTNSKIWIDTNSPYVTPVKYFDTSTGSYKGLPVGDSQLIMQTTIGQLEYSNTEQVIGKWTNGKPIYRIVGGSLPATAETVLLAEGRGNPIGTVISFMGKTAPQDYLACDGTTYNISAYTELAAYIKDQFGKSNYFGGNGTSTFAVPDLRGEFLRGTGTNSYANQGNGADVGVHQDGTNQVAAVGGSNNQLTYAGGQNQRQAANVDYVTDYSNAYHIGTTSVYYLGYNAISGFTSRPTNTSVLYCIKCKNLKIYEYTKTTDSTNSFDASTVAYVVASKQYGDIALDNLATDAEVSSVFK